MKKLRRTYNKYGVFAIQLRDGYKCIRSMIFGFHNKNRHHGDREWIKRFYEKVVKENDEEES